MKKTAVVFMVVAGMIALSAIVFLGSSFYSLSTEHIRYELSRTVYDIVEESYMNYGNIEYSQYQDIISANDYDRMYYLGGLNNDDSDQKYYDRSAYDIIRSYHSQPEVTMISSTEAVITYMYDMKYYVKQTPQYRGGHAYYGDCQGTGAIGHCTVKMNLQSDGKWHVVEFSDPP